MKCKDIFQPTRSSNHAGKSSIYRYLTNVREIITIMVQESVSVLCSGNTSYIPIVSTEASHSPWLVNEELDMGLLFKIKEMFIHLMYF